MQEAWERGAMADNDRIAALVREGVALAEAGRGADAVAAFERALALAPGEAQLHWLCGTAERVAGRPARAIERYRAALGIDPGHAASLGNLAEIGDPEEVAALLAKAIAALPDRADLRFRLGTVLNRQGRGAEAVDCFVQAIALEPKVAPFHVNHGIALRQAGRLAESVAAFDRALALKPGDPLAHWNRGLSLLGLGRLAEGWADYEHRLRLPSAPRPVSLAPWDGQARDKVLVRREQGLGDELLFANCLPDLLQATAGASIECDQRLATLYRRSFPVARIVPVRRPQPGQPDPPAEPGDSRSWVALGSLPGRFRRAMDAFPATGGYLKADPTKIAWWREFLGGLGPGRKIGLCWRSSQVGGARDQRYARIEELAALFALPDVKFVSLQLNLAPAERAVAGGGLHEAPDLDLRDDIDGVAALVAALDRVVTIDSWILSLAGALGVETRFLASHRDWATLGTDRMPWAPSVAVDFVRPGGWGAACRAAAG